MTERNIFYGAAIQGSTDRAMRAHIHEGIITCIEEQGFQVVYDHTRGRTKQETGELLRRRLPNIPEDVLLRKRYIRKKMIDGVEGKFLAAIFELSEPSTGSGDEFAHAYLRPRLGLSEIPILVLYEKDYWQHGLSTMIFGIDPEELPNIYLREYQDLGEAMCFTKEFLSSL